MQAGKQLELIRRPLPKHIVVVRTDDVDISTPEGCETAVRRMLNVPLDKSILLDFLVGRKRGGPHPSEEHAELHRLMALLNSQFRHRRFDWLGDSLTARMVRESIRTRAWDPFRM